MFDRRSWSIGVGQEPTWLTPIDQLPMSLTLGDQYFRYVDQGLKPSARSSGPRLSIQRYVTKV